MFSRRKFFGAAAAASVAAAVPSRYAERFARTLEDRPATTLPKEGTAEIIFRLYDGEKVVHKQTAWVKTQANGNETYLGVGEDVLMEGFEGRADRLTVGVPAFPYFESDSTPQNNTFPVNISHGDTLTLSANNRTGFLKVG